MGFKEVLGRNLRQPAGFVGKLVGLIMNKGNDFMNRFTLNFLESLSSDRILEIGLRQRKILLRRGQLK